MIKLTGKNGAIDLSKKMLKGDDGGYYIPKVSNDGILTWVPSEPDMKPAEEASIIGPPGPQGETGIHVGPDEPVDKDVVVWIDTDAVSADELATKEYVDQAVANVKPEVDLSNYYTKTQVDALIPDTSGFALKTEIPDTSGFTTMSAVEEKGYQTEAQVLALITANIPASGDEVSY